MDTPTEEDLERFARSPRAYSPSQLLPVSNPAGPPASQPEQQSSSYTETVQSRVQDHFTLEITSCPATVSSSEPFTIGIKLTYNSDPLGRGRPVLLAARASPLSSPGSSSAMSTQSTFPLENVPGGEYPFPSVDTSHPQQPSRSRAVPASTVQIFPGQSVSTDIEIDPSSWNLRAGTTYRLLSLGAELPASTINSWRWGSVEDLSTSPASVASEAYNLSGQVIVLAQSNSVRISVRP